MKALQFLSRWFVQVSYLLILFFYFCWKVVVSGWVVGWWVIRGYRGENEGIIEYPVKGSHPWHRILLFNLMSMTPGSLCIDIDPVQCVLTVHLLNLDDLDDFYATAGKVEHLLSKIFTR